MFSIPFASIIQKWYECIMPRRFMNCELPSGCPGVTVASSCHASLKIRPQKPVSLFHKKIRCLVGRLFTHPRRPVCSCALGTCQSKSLVRDPFARCLHLFDDDETQSISVASLSDIVNLTKHYFVTKWPQPPPVNIFCPPVKVARSARGHRPKPVLNGAGVYSRVWRWII